MEVSVFDIAGLLCASVGILFVAAAGLSWIGRTTYRRLSKRVRDARVDSLHDVEDDRVVGIRGIVSASEQGRITSPVSGRRGVCIRIMVHQYKRRKGSARWHEVLDVTEAHEFFVEDDSGVRVRIIPTKLRSMIDTTEIARSGSVLLGDQKTEAASQLTEDYLRTKGMSSVNMFGFNKTMRFEDAVLLEGAEVFAVGALRRMNLENKASVLEAWQAAPWSAPQLGTCDKSTAAISKDGALQELQLYGGPVAGYEVYITNKRQQELLDYFSQEFSTTRDAAMFGGSLILLGLLILLVESFGW